MPEAQAKIDMTQVVSGNRDFVKAADYRTIYANQIQISLTPFDFQLSFSQGSAPGGIALNELQATVFISPVEAKVLTSLLTKVLGDYERQFGAIPVPPQLLAPAPETPGNKT